MGMKRVIEAIVLRKTNYSETSLILQLLTETEGIRSFIFKGARKPGKGGNIFAPLSVVSVEFHDRNDSGLAIISSASLSVIHKTVLQDPFKSSVVFFMNEILLNAVHEQEDSLDLYQYIRKTLILLDSENNSANFPVKMLVDLAGLLGFFPNTDRDGEILDLKEASLVHHIPSHELYADKAETALILQLARTPFEEIPGIQIPLSVRRQLVRKLISYYKIVIDNWTELRSLSVLEEIHQG